MDATDSVRPEPQLDLWALASFRATTFTIAAVLVLHLRDRLPAALERLSTALGMGFFLLLWTTTFYASRWGLALRQREQSSDDDRGAAAVATFVAGAWNGVYVFAALALVAIGLSITSPLRAAVVLFASVLGALLAFTIGGLVALLYAIGELALATIADRIVRYAVGLREVGADGPREEKNIAATKDSR